MPTAGAQQGIVCLDMWERSQPSLLHWSDGINAADVLHITLFCLVRKSKAYLWWSFFPLRLDGDLRAEPRWKPPPLYKSVFMFHHLNSRLCPFVVTFKGPSSKTCSRSLKTKQQFGSVRRYYLQRAERGPGNQSGAFCSRDQSGEIIR